MRDVRSGGGGGGGSGNWDRGCLALRFHLEAISWWINPALSPPRQGGLAPPSPSVPPAALGQRWTDPHAGLPSPLLSAVFSVDCGFAVFPARMPGARRCWWGRGVAGGDADPWKLRDLLSWEAQALGASRRLDLHPVASPGRSVSLTFLNQLWTLLWVTPLIPAPACTWLFLACLLLTSLLLSFRNGELGVLGSNLFSSSACLLLPPAHLVGRRAPDVPGRP